jgi:predicted Zn-dependent protease
MTACADSKETTSSKFDMSEYRKMMERQKNEQTALESTETKAPDMTPEEHERAGDDEAQRRNFPLAGLHYTKALNADPTKNTVRLKLAQLMLQQGMFDAAVTQFQDPNHRPRIRVSGRRICIKVSYVKPKRLSTKPSRWILRVGYLTTY